MNKLNLFRVATFVFGLVPSAFMCLLAWILVESFVRHPTADHVIQFLMGLGGFAGTLGFALVIFLTGCYKKFTGFLLLWGIVSMSLLISSMPRDAFIGLAIYGTILGLGVLSLWIEMKTQNPSSENAEHSSG